MEEKQMIREANPIVVVDHGGVIIFADGRIVYKHKDPPEDALLVGEIGMIASTMYYVALMKDSTYRSSTLEYLNRALEEKTKALSTTAKSV
jgi:hypothetical protein